MWCLWHLCPFQRGKRRSPIFILNRCGIFYHGHGHINLNADVPSAWPTSTFILKVAKRAVLGLLAGLGQSLGGSLPSEYWPETQFQWSYENWCCQVEKPLCSTKILCVHLDHLVSLEWRIVQLEEGRRGWFGLAGSWFREEEGEEYILIKDSVQPAFNSVLGIS